MTAEEIVEQILDAEGPGDPAKGYLTKNDLGGRTNWGISERAHPEEWANGKVPSKARAREIYLHEYVRPWATIEDDALRAQLVDWSVLHGESRTRKWVLRCISRQRNVSMIQPMTLSNEQINYASRNTFFCDALVAYRLKLIDEISDANVKQKAFEEGWENRALSFLSIA